MDRQEAIDFLVDHFNDPQHKRRMEEPDVSLPGGNPGCGDVVIVYLRSEGDEGAISDYSWEGEGCTISQAAASVIAEMVHEDQMTTADILNFSYDDLMDVLGREIVQTRTRCATLALGTLKAAVRKLERDRQLIEAGRPDLVNNYDYDLSDFEEFGLVVGDKALTEENSRVGHE